MSCNVSTESQRMRMPVAVGVGFARSYVCDCNQIGRLCSLKKLQFTPIAAARDKCGVGPKGCYRWDSDAGILVRHSASTMSIEVSGCCFLLFDHRAETSYGPVAVSLSFSNEFVVSNMRYTGDPPQFGIWNKAWGAY